MADTELHYIAYDPDAIWAGMMEAYVEQGGDILYGGDEKEVLLRAVQEMMVNAFALVDNALRMQTVRYAQGDYLKLLGAERGAEYIDAVAAAGTMRIDFREGLTETEIEAGASFTPDGIRFYTTDSAVYYDGTAASVEVGITCAEGGVSGNGLETGTDMTPEKATACIEHAEIVTATAGGADAEDMEAYRERVREAVYAVLTTGPKEQYRARALAASAEIYDAVIEEGEPGEVWVYLAISDDVDAADVIAQTEEALSADDVRPLTDNVYVRAADEIPYNIDVEVKIPGGVSAEDLENAAAEYRQWQENTIARAFDPYQLIAYLYKAGAERVTILSTSRVNGQALNYLELGSHERAKGTVNISES